jgi:hypothetical protein
MMPPDSPKQQPKLCPELRHDVTFQLIGLGGVGSILARYVSVLLASICSTNNRHATLQLIDGDDWSSENAHRALFSRVGKKAEVLREELLPYFLDGPLTLIAVPEYVTPKNVQRLLQSGADRFVLLCPDNHATRKLVSDFTCGMNGYPGLDDLTVISGGNDGVTLGDENHPPRTGTFGNVQLLIRRGGRNLTPSLSEYHPEIANPADRLPHEMSCVEMQDRVPQVLAANLQVAAAMLSTTYLVLCHASSYAELVFDIAEARMLPVPLPIVRGMEMDSPGCGG